MKDEFKSVATTVNSDKWNNAIKREKELYSRGNDIRSEFERDYTRVIYSLAYRRMKHKTQVFFSPKDDHICTRIEHVTLVDSISNTIAKYLGLNTELTKAIATAHDLGHSPFGHQGEKILSEICEREFGIKFWHERNGLELVDNLELLEDDKNNLANLYLKYAVRDGIVSHCGEIDENSIKPREDCIDLSEYQHPNQFNPYTWEGCVVKISDKIAYLGRDIQDAIKIGLITDKMEEFNELMRTKKGKPINNTVIINDLITDLCQNSSIENGLSFSQEKFEFINKIKQFNYRNIYLNEKNKMGTEYFKLIINTIYNVLYMCLQNEEKRKMYQEVYSTFEEWLKAYWDGQRKDKYKNKVLFHRDNELEMKHSIIYYISGMTDNFAIDTFNKIIDF